MKTFEQYLRENNHTESTIEGHLKSFRYFEDWTITQKIEDPSFVKMATVLEYVKELQSQKLQVGTINNRLNSLKKYFCYQIEQGLIVKNPIRNLTIRGQEKRVIQNTLNQEELNDLYLNYTTFLKTKLQERKPNNYIPQPKREESNLRYKLIASLLIYQAIQVTELNKLNISDVNLTTGTLYIPSSKRSNSRVLNLNSIQIISFYEYINTLSEEQEKLFCIDVPKAIPNILSELKTINPKIKNTQQIRVSVLVEWIKTYGKRTAQYMIGYKYVSSIEKFEQQDTRTLLELVNKVHLFG